MFKKSKILLFLVVLFILSFAKPISANEILNIYFFWGQGCPHCEKEKEFLEEIKKDYENIKIYDFEIYNHGENILLLQKINSELGMRIDGVPFIIIGDQQFVGYSEQLTPQELKNRIDYCLNNNCKDEVSKILGINPISENPNINNSDNGENISDNPDENNHAPINNKEINLPFLGKINISSFSLPILTIIMGGLDGFNPCAMWTLLFLISLLLGMKDRKRMWILGTTFIIASASVYFLFMAAWLNLILFLGFIIWIRILIGLVALGGGTYNLKKYFVNKSGVCKVAGDEKRQKVFEKLKKVTESQSFWLAFAGIILLAFAVNLVELICSAGLPTVYTQVLTLSNLENWQYYFYIFLYIFIFMLDDLIVFFIAMITLEMTGITTKYAKISKLIGAILMIIIGLLLIFKPELLMFG